MTQLENYYFVEEVNGLKIVENIYAINEIDDKTDQILVKHDEIIEVMSVEDIIYFFENEKSLFTSKEIDYYCDINDVEFVSKPCEFWKTKRKFLKRKMAN